MSTTRVSLKSGQEKQFFHWITARALRELAEERQISFSVNMSGTRVSSGLVPIRFGFPENYVRELSTLGALSRSKRNLVPATLEYTRRSRQSRSGGLQCE
jgi:hypothetical protein